jgi:hypothetical protein
MSPFYKSPNHTSRSFFGMAFIFCFASLSLTAQVKLYIEDVKISSQVPPDVPKRLFRATQAALLEYEKAASMLDANTSKVSGSAVERFKKMLTPNAKLLQDFVPKSTTMLDASEYAAAALGTFANTGMPSQLLSAKADRIVYEGNSYFVYVKVDKKMLVSLENGTVSKVSGNKVKTTFVYQMERNKQEDAYLFRVLTRVDKVEPIEPEITATVYGRYGIANYALKQPSATTFALTAPSDFGVGLRFDYITAQKIIIGLGAQYNKQGFSFNAAPYNYKVLTNTTGAGGKIATTEKYDKTVDISNLTGSCTMSSLSIPLSLGYRLVNTKKYKVNLRAFALANLMLSANETSSAKVVYTGDFTETLSDGRVVTFTITDLKAGSYNLGVQAANVNAAALDTKTSFAAGLEPEFQYIINKQIRLSIAASYVQNLTTLLDGKGNATDVEIFSKNETNDNKSVLQTYMNNLGYAAPNISIGVVYRFIKD